MLKFDILELGWLECMPEEADLCAHGTVRIRAGEHALEGEVSMSAAALHLLRTVADDHEPDEMAKLFPTDGFSWTPAGGVVPYGIYLGGCPNGGFDGRVTHEGDHVRVALTDLPEVCMPLEAWRGEVFSFVDEVEALFRRSRPKVVTAELDQLWYPLFWEEWRRIRDSKSS